MLTLERLSKSYGESIAVTDVSLQVPAGQMLGIIGRSGAGKSTLLRMLNRLIEPSSGTIAWNKVEVTSLSGSALHWKIPGTPRSEGASIPLCHLWRPDLLNTRKRTSGSTSACSTFGATATSMTAQHQCLDRQQ